MNVLDKVLTLRPTSVVSRLGHASRLPVLSPRELSRALENAPAAFMGMLRGENVGKRLVRVGDDPTVRPA